MAGGEAGEGLLEGLLEGLTEMSSFGWAALEGPHLDEVPDIRVLSRVLCPSPLSEW